MTTLPLFVERLRRHLAGGFPTIHDRVGDAEIKYQVQSAVNRLLKTEVLSTNFSLDGGSIPDGVVIATYEDVEVTEVAGRLVAKLPVAPMYLPERMGVFAVIPYAEDVPDYDDEYVPIPVGQYRALSPFSEISSLLGEKSYTWDGMKIVLHGPYNDDNDDLPPDPAPEKVMIKLCVADLDTLADDDPLPLSPDLEEQAMSAVIQFYTAQPTTPRDEGTEATPRKADK